MGKANIIIDLKLETIEVQALLRKLQRKLFWLKIRIMFILKIKRLIKLINKLF